MKGKICLVTGGTNGIGKSTALELARMGANVIIVGRNAQKTSQVVEEIRLATGNMKVESLLADFSSLQDVRQLAVKHIILIVILTILAINTFSQSRLSNHEISINGFRNPSIGLEYRYRHVSLHTGYYPTNFESGVTVLPPWLLMIDH